MSIARRLACPCAPRTSETRNKTVNYSAVVASPIISIRQIGRERPHLSIWVANRNATYNFDRRTTSKLHQISYRSSVHNRISWQFTQGQTLTCMWERSIWLGRNNSLYKQHRKMSAVISSLSTSQRVLYVEKINQRHCRQLNPSLNVACKFWNSWEH